jgi:16S rRNA (adenine1518-N6/adenine1519-N6)-dimethyltransferase
MFQKELGDRIIAKEDSKTYGRISVLTQSRFSIRKLLIAPSGIFNPKPKVDGIVLEFSPIKKYKDIEIKKLEAILNKAFLHRRKKIRTSLNEYKDILELNNFNLDLRAENLTTADYCRLSKLI